MVFRGGDRENPGLIDRYSQKTHITLPNNDRLIPPGEADNRIDRGLARIMHLVG